MFDKHSTGLCVLSTHTNIQFLACRPQLHITYETVQHPKLHNTYLTPKERDINVIVGCQISVF